MHRTGFGFLARLSLWGRLVAVSAVLVVGGAAGMAAWGIASTERRVATYSVRGTINAIQVDLDGGEAEIVGGSPETPVVRVRRTDRFAFGHDAAVTRGVSGGVLRLGARCPDTVLHACSSSYRLTVPPNIPVSVSSGRGDVHLNGFRGSARIGTSSGDIVVRGYCGFSLQARADTGDLDVAARCSPERLALRSRAGSVRAVVPAGRYRIDADTDGGSRELKGLTSSDDAPFQIQALSGTGDVLVEARR